MKILDYRISLEDIEIERKDIHRAASHNPPDNSEYCCYCGEELTLRRGGKQKTSDHLIPLSRGGANNTFNKRNCCLHCNTQKKNMFPQQYLEYVKFRYNYNDGKVRVENIEHIIRYINEKRRLLFKTEKAYQYFKKRYLKTTA